MTVGNNGQLLLTGRQASKALAISPSTLWKLTKRGEVRCVRLGRAVRYDPRDLKAFIDRVRTSGAEGCQNENEPPPPTTRT